MKLDTHVHTFHSGRASVFPFNHFMRECYNTPESVYDTAKRRGMDLVTVTDHDQISGALEIAHRPDVLVGCEVTAEFTDVDLCVHLNVLDISPAQHDESQRLRHDVRQLMPYLSAQGIYTSLNHVARQARRSGARREGARGVARRGRGATAWDSRLPPPRKSATEDRSALVGLGAARLRGTWAFGPRGKCASPRAKRVPGASAASDPVEARSAESHRARRARPTKAYQNPSHFHHTPPAASQMTMFATEVTNPTRHQSPRDT